MSKNSESTAFIIIGVIILMLGYIQPARYEHAKENGYEVDATIVSIKSRRDEDSMRHNIYVDYEVDGKEYKNVKARTNYSNECSDRVGDIIKIVVNPNSPGKLMFEGGILGVIGLLVLIFGIITKISKKRAK